MPKQVASGPQQGYLLLADISGYTEFLTGTELDHAQEIIHELTSLIRERLTPPLRFVKLEGDAVFCYAPTKAFGDGERFVELIEACYFEYSNRLDDMARATICRCSACAAIGSLGLKFVAHYGTFIVERDGDREDLAGPDVILAHRLLKNTISENGGPSAYAFLTDACLAQMPRSLPWPKHTEAYESFGETNGGVHDLSPVLAGMREDRREYITSEQADSETVFEVPVPPGVAWKYFVNPIERQRWICRQRGTDPDEQDVNASGRVGSGAVTHCGHGPGVTHREVIDWRPFSYFTARSLTPAAGAWVTGRPAVETVEFEPQGDHGTRVTWRFRIVQRGRIPTIAFAVTRPLMRAFLRKSAEALQSIAEEDAAAMGLS